MKDRFDQYQDRLNPGERQRVWQSIRSATTARAHTAERSSFDRRRWFTPALVGALATAVVVAVLLPRHATDKKLQQVAAGRPAPATEPAPSTLGSLPYRGGSDAPQSAKPESSPRSATPGGQEGKASVTAPVNASRVAADERKELSKREDDGSASPAPVAPVKSETWGGIRDRAKQRSDSDQPIRQQVMKKDLESLPSEEIDAIAKLKSSAVAKEGEVHIRGGRAAEAPEGASSAGGLDAVYGNAESGDVPYLPNQQPPTAPPTSGAPKEIVVIQTKVRIDKKSATTAPSVPAPLPYGGSALPNDEEHAAMFFEHHGVNPFLETAEDSLSTFAVDVDNASYTLMRNYVLRGSLPSFESVRVEEFVNFFAQDYPKFDDADFRVVMDGAPSPFGGDGYQLLRVGVKARTIDAKDRKPANLTFVIDVSGSMEIETRLLTVKESLGLMLRELSPKDRVSIVVYGSQAQVVLPPTSIEERAVIERAIEGLRTEGSTNAEAGLLLGYEQADAMFNSSSINRVLLCTDGVANVGRTGADSILEKIGKEARRGIYLTACGFGMGNYNDVLLEKLADQGDGNYYYIDSLDEAYRVLVENLTGTLQTVARDVKIQVAFDPSQVREYRLLGFENRDVADRDFRNDAVDAGEIGAGHEVTALYELKLAVGAPRGRLAEVRVRWAEPEQSETPKVHEIAERFYARDLEESFDRATPRFRLDAVVAEYAEILRRSFWAKENRIENLLPLARAAERELPSDESVHEFVQLLETAAGLEAKSAPEPAAEGER